MRTNQGSAVTAGRTFTQQKRRDQLVDCMIDVIADLGFARASVGELARRARVSKGVITYHFPAKDDLISAVIADVLGSMGEYLVPRLWTGELQRVPERFVAAYITAWAGYYRSHAREVLALVRIYNGFRDESGRPDSAFDVRGEDIGHVAQVLRRGQELGRLGPFDPLVMAAVIKAALDDLLIQFADNPGLDLEAYAAELVALFERATRPADGAPAAATDAAGPFTR